MSDPAALPDDLDLRDDDRALRAAVEAWRTPVTASAGFDARVMAAVRAAPAPGRSVWHRFAEPRTTRWSPLVRGLAAAAGVALVFLAGRASAPGRPGPLEPRGAVTAPIRFVHVAPGATAVSLVGDFNEWNLAATPLVRRGDGVWITTVPLTPGVHEYAFVVDGRDWRPDPTATPAPGDDFDRPNSQLIVGTT